MRASFLIAAGGLWLVGFSAWANDAAQDVIIRTNGERQVARIEQVSDQVIRVAVVVIPGQPAALVSIPRSEIAEIHPAMDAVLTELANDPAKVPTPELEALWNKWQPVLGLPRTPGGQAGLILGDRLLGTRKAKQALDYFQQIEKASWSEKERIAGKRGRLRAMIASGKAAEAEAEARAFAAEAEDASLVIEANQILADVAYENLRKLVQENPRWVEDIQVRPQRDQLYHEALDLYLYPFLFHGSDSESAARGLWGAAQVYQFCGELPSAKSVIDDLIALYPDTSYAKSAQDFLNKSKPSPSASNHEKTDK